ncbi:origin recognition complex subunit 1 isoform X2 [Osmerus eperlanus]|uniref:origin recognition complex subunit 1 isoform X2 n=1 Tax=Osmerus eperlanus TaxID=29151 RepID=UPI002E1213B9
MARYCTRLRVRRVYKWRGTPISFDRKLKTFSYDSLDIRVEGLSGSTVINTGQYILIEGEDEENPYVAKVTKLFGDESQKQKKALVQWFVRISEVPPRKMKQVGRDPHPQEVFYYLTRACDNEINAESILSTVQVKHLHPDDPFPESQAKDTLYVKLSWDTKTFKVLDPALMQDTPTSPPPRPKPSLPPSPPSPPHAATPASRGPERRALPTPDPSVMCRAGSASTGKRGFVEAESVHSTSKLSASKSLSARRRGSVSGTPGVRKKLQLNNPGATLIPEDVLGKYLGEELESEILLAQKLSSSPVSTIAQSYSLCPRKAARLGPGCQDTTPLKASVSLERLSPVALGEQDSDRASTPSRRRDASRSTRERALAVLEEVEMEDSPLATPVAMTPRSKRKSALLVSSRIRRQLNLLSNEQDVTSDGDGGDDDCFLPSKKALQSSSEEEEQEEESDEEILVRKSKRAVGSRTPRSTQKARAPARTPRKTPSKKSTPGTPRTPRHATPSIPSRTLPAQQPGNVLEEARTRLHVSSVPESLPCREQEFQDIYSFVESKIMDGTGGCMYISGVPGTGKTATVHEVVRCLQHAAHTDDIPAFRFVEINGMKMTDPHQAYVQILQELTGQKATADHAASLLEKRFSNPAPKKETTVLLVDELDLLWTRKQNVMYNLFDWPTRRHARLVVLTIANTMDLPERIMINRVASRLGLTRMSFQPYSYKQLQQIITSRLNKVKAFEEDALQLVSRKVAALSGDARRCLDICRRATEVCEHSAPSDGPVGLVAMSHVMETLDEMFSSAYVTAIRCASVQEQFFLRAIIAEFRRLGLEEATFQQVFVQHQALCRVEGLQPVSVSEGLAACRRLGACRLLLLEPSRLDVLQRVRLNVSQDDVLYALKAD